MVERAGEGVVFEGGESVKVAPETNSTSCAHIAALFGRVSASRLLLSLSLSGGGSRDPGSRGWYCDGQGRMPVHVALEVAAGVEL